MKSLGELDCEYGKNKGLWAASHQFMRTISLASCRIHLQPFKIVKHPIKGFNVSYDQPLKNNLHVDNDKVHQEIDILPPRKKSTSSLLRVVEKTISQ